MAKPTTAQEKKDWGPGSIASLMVLEKGRKDPSVRSIPAYSYFRENYIKNYQQNPANFKAAGLKDPSEYPSVDIEPNAPAGQADIVSTNQPSQNQMAAAAQANTQASSQPQAPVESAPIGQGFQGTPDVPLGGSNIEEAFKKKTGSILLR